MIQFFSDTDILNRRVDNIDTGRLATLQSQDWTTLQQSDLATPHIVRGALGNPHVIHDDVALCRRQTWQRCILSGIQRTHTPSIYMHTYVLVSSRAPWHRLLGRGLSCEKARGNVPVLRVHIIALRWYFLCNKVLCFFFSVTACHVFVRFAIPVKLCLQQDHLIRLTH